MSNRYPGVTVHGVYTGKLDDGGEKIWLRNSDGNTIISVEYDDDPPWPLSPDGLGYSLVLEDPFGSPDSADTWRASSGVHGSPGADDPAPPYPLGVVINELLVHADPPFEDAIELHNTSVTAVDIGGWFLSDDFVRTNPAAAYDLKKYRIPTGSIIPPGGFIVFYENDFRSNNPTVPFALSELGEKVYLSSATTNGTLTGYLAGATFGASANGVSIGRYSTSRGIDFVPLSRNTFGNDTPATLGEFRLGTGAPNAPPRVGPLVLNEIMYNPTAGGSEFLEFLNITAVPLDVSGWTVAGASFTFPPDTVLPANGLALLLKTNTTSVGAFRGNYSVPASVPVFPHDFVLENEGEALRIDRPNSPLTDPSIMVERVRYNDKSPWPTEADGEGPSLERFAATEYGNDPINWRTVASGGSPGRLNVFNAGVAISKHSSWNYHASGGNLGTPWRDLDYSDGGWPDGDGALGYGASGLGTVIPYGPSATNKPMTVYFRKEFVINDPLSAIRNLRLEAMYDDGFVLHLNGTEVLRSASIPNGPIAFNTPAATSYNSLGYEVFDLSAQINLLRPGNNVLCAEVHQVTSDSDDLVWDASLTFDVSTLPTVMLHTVAPAPGVFAGPVQVNITTVPTDATIYYTVNGTEPDESSTRYTAPFTVATTTEVRARAYKTGYNESGVAIATYVLPGPGILSVAPSGTTNSAGTTGGAFHPASILYTLTNLGGLSLDWTATVSENWLTLSAASGTLAPGSGSNVLASFNTNADGLPTGDYNAVVTFRNDTTGVEVLSRAVALSVSPIRMSVNYSASGALEITLNGHSDQAYVIEASSNLIHWTSIVTNVAGPRGALLYIDAPDPSMAHRFYRGWPHR